MTANQADVIYFGGDIVTVDADEVAPPEAVAVKDGTIVFVGDRAQALDRWQGADTILRDLQGGALLPGFIDAHSHLGGIGLQATIANLLAEPDGDVTDIRSLQDKLREFAESETGQDSAWIVGFGYDDAMLAERRHPTREELDAVSTDKPVLAIHQSFHLGAVNSKGLEMLKYTRFTPNPDGGVIRRRLPIKETPPCGEPNGVLEETAFTPASNQAIAGLSALAQAGLVAKGLKAAATFGFTTMQEGGTSLDNLAAFRKAAEQAPFALDVVIYAKADEATAAPGDPVEVGQDYCGGLRAAGIKLFLDGSPQGRTAWLTKPYKNPPEGQEADYRGYPTTTDDEVLRQVRRGFQEGWQILAHVNGDAAIDQFIRAVETATEEYGPADRRIVAVHAQTARQDQIEAFKRLGIIPSFFSMHTFYWGDWYRETVLGEKRAENISPAKWALDRQMIYTSHHDAPVALPNSFRVLASQVTRITRSGRHILGPEQRVSALDAVKSITINAAYQYFEESAKGSIQVGKLADLVILSSNPLTIPPEEIKDITVTETIKAGKRIHPPATGDHEHHADTVSAPFEFHGHC
ncbi:amidohydrolase [Streptosporangium sp. NPDC000396]|uniref:amidohydrolase n=1 Tax=Streptosporangium sp. NPDC000396 TaxID=3366185 RepID=UPI00369F4CD4